LSRHRILILGAAGGGRRWLARRIHDLTGIPVHGADPTPPEVPAAGREWVVVAEAPEGLEACVARADLVVLVRTPLWLRGARLALAALPFRERRPGWRGLAAEWRRSRAWDADVGPRWGRVLGARGGGAGLVMKCGSADDVRGVLERVFGIEPGSDPTLPGRLAG
jgi:hypothetical protein